MQIQLYHGEGSNCCQRIRWILNYKGISFEEIDCTEMPPEQYREINPFLTAPTLVVDGNVILESLVQAEFLESQFPHPSLSSRDLWVNMRIREVCQVMAATIHPHQTVKAAKLAMPGGSADELKAYRQKTIVAGLEKLATRLFQESSFSVGTQFSLADIFVIPLYLKAKNLSPALRMKGFEELIESCRNDAAILNSSPRDMMGLRD